MRYLYLIFLILFVFTNKLFAIQTIQNGNVEFSANKIEYNINDEIFIATGSVNFISENEILKTDQMFYDAKNKLLIAKGNVYYKDATGVELYSKEITLDSELSLGQIESLELIMKDGSTFNGKSVAKEKEGVYTGSNFAFSTCKTSYESSPTIAFKSKSGKYDENKDTIELYNSWIELKGIPVFYIGYISFSNLNSKRKDGFLLPSIETNSILGTKIIIPYYAHFGESNDLILETHIYEKQNPLLKLKYAGFVDNGSYSIEASYTDTKKDFSGTNEDLTRGYYFINYKQNINDTFRVSSTLQRVSDPRYLKRYNITPIDSKISFYQHNVYLEGFFNQKSYLDIGAYEFKNINPIFVKDYDHNREINMHYKVMDNYFEYGNFTIDTDVSSFFETHRNNNIYRFAFDTNYEYYVPTTYGNYTVDLELRGVSYNYTNSEINNNKKNGLGDYASYGASLTVDYPYIYNISTNYFVLMPTAQISASDYIKNNKSSNYFDSYNLDLGMNNLFNINHYSGYDLIDNSKYNFKYGFKITTLSTNNNTTTVFAGQMLSFEQQANKYDSKNSNSFVSIKNKSNYFVYFNTNITNSLNITYDAVIDNNLNEVSSIATASYNTNFLTLGVNYANYNNLDTNVYSIDKISEIGFNSVINIMPNIRARLNTLYGLQNKEENYQYGIKELTTALAWVDDCVDFEIYVKNSFYSNNPQIYGFKIYIKGIDSIEFSI